MVFCEMASGKEPPTEPFYSVELQAGNFGLVRPTFDLFGPLNSERTLRYRLNAAYENDGNFRDYDLLSIATGEQRSRGIELDVSGEILTGWNIIASYAYTDAEVTEDNRLPEGNRLVGVPYNAASLWTTYEIQTGDLQGLGFGLGLFYVGDRAGDLANTFEVSDYIRTDGSIFYQKTRMLPMTPAMHSRMPAVKPSQRWAWKAIALSLARLNGVGCLGDCT